MPTVKELLNSRWHRIRERVNGTELAEIRTEQATIKSNLETVITEQAVIKSSLASIQDSLFRLEKAFSNPPPSTDSTGNNKRSNLAIQAPSNTLKKVKIEMLVKEEM